MNSISRSTWTRLGLEVRITGAAALVTALAAPLGGAVLVAVLYATGASAADLDRAAGAVLAGFAPLGVAVATSSIVGPDPGAELVMTTTPYRRVLFLRAALVAAAGALASLLDAIVFHALGAWPLGQGSGGYVLVWAPPMIWLSALAMLSAVATRSTAAASGLIGGVWLAQLVFAHDMRSYTVLRAQYLFMSVADRVQGHDLAVNRIALPAVGVAALAAASLLLGRPERFLGRDVA
ncbi:hypothetical protein [Actinacidiphila oryziradicis]|uniref:Uncharacterized protein n=1 Tax=Actinacidiphila oryziradicis TaxID=2571141 RepID=A0A4U0RNE6_9ACTN|nr:hypothetical protein [Actinacidiphila oryziradicis]TJZ97409.1 hypothetical protein FCI23_49845 [Actinacidiphila oryziradicis]